ncbi:hypothetical protein ACN083_00115 [Rothia sp. CCM 9418]|uniref:hypothetical protein n=1 Tax=Rothia sp. CCM 9418 TaxID=3402661 RepID=UPI003ADE9617
MSEQYSSTPKKRRGHRRVVSGDSSWGKEPKIIGVLSSDEEARKISSEEDSRAQWLKEQRPPHHDFRSSI